MAMKLDMSKTCDRVEWNFIRRMMLKLGCEVRFIDLIMKCITSVSYSILYNGFPSQGFTPPDAFDKGGKMCKSKREGGLGMRDLSAFNTTLLANNFGDLILIYNPLLPWF